MDYISLGKSELLVSRTAFGAVALEDASSDAKASDMAKIAFDEGVNFFDTARSSPESEERLGEAVKPFRKDIFLATKTRAHTSDELSEDIDSSLRALQTDYIDLYQLDSPSILPEIDGADGLIERLQRLKKDGIIHHFGITTDNFDIARAALNSNVGWETIQFPFNVLCTKEIEDFVADCQKSDIGFIAMRPLCGGIVQDIQTAFSYLHQFDWAVPVWGLSKKEELRQILKLTNRPPQPDQAFFDKVKVLREFFN